jgi:hypothetical protein
MAFISIAKYRGRESEHPCIQSFNIKNEVGHMDFVIDSFYFLFDGPGV